MQGEKITIVLSEVQCTIPYKVLYPLVEVVSRKSRVNFCVKFTVLHTIHLFYLPGTAEGEGLVGPRPHHFFASPPSLFALKRKMIKIKKRLETSFFRLYSAIFSVFSLISNARHFVGLLCFSR